MMIAANRMFLPTKKGKGSSSMPCSVWFARARKLVISSTAATTMPATSEVVRNVSPPNTSGMKPELSN